jgi:hypothetical protein
LARAGGIVLTLDDFADLSKAVPLRAAQKCTGISASEGAFKKTAAGCCLGRSLVEVSASFGVARLYSTIPRAWPP